MTQLSHTPALSTTQGLDVIERLAERNGWALEQTAAGDLTLDCTGEWGEYLIQFTWSREHRSLHISCDINFIAPEKANADLHSLVNMINARLWIGHFALNQQHRISYRHTLIVPNASEQKAGEAEDIIQTALGECDRFYPAFQFVAFQGMSADQAMTSALWECAGQA